MSQSTPGIITYRRICRPADTAAGVLLRAPFVAVDIETTGTSGMDQIIELAGVKMRADGTVLDSFTSLANPGPHVPLNPAAEKVHGITAAQIRTAPPLRAVLAQFRDFVGPLGLVAHNLPFENRFLSAAYRALGDPVPAWQGICTMRAAKDHFKAESNTLAHLLELFDLDASNTHRALDDAHACGALLAAMIQRRGLTDLVPLETAPAAPQRAARPAPRRQPSAPVSSAEVADAFGGHTPTDEQMDAVAKFQSGERLKIVAVAGSGKSSTLLGMARLEQRRDPSRRGHIIAFNRSVAEELKRKVPETVTASTAHSLAYRHIRSTAHGPLLDKLNAPRASWRSIIAAVGAEKLWLTTSGRPRPMSEYMVARLGLATVEKFCQSTDSVIGPQHVPSQPGIYGDDLDALRDKVVRCANRAWKNLTNPNTFEVKFTPSHYLKLWEQTGPVFGTPGGFLAFDEAQDASPILRSIVLQQEHLQTVFVGDSAQAIYRFTGAVDALDELRDTTTATLTRSFRFGDTVADAANTYLAKLGERVRVRGNPAIDSRRVGSTEPVDAVLCRTNADAIASVMAAQKTGTPTAFEGDVHAALRFCDSADRLKDGQNPTDPELAAFSSWIDLSEYVENVPGVSELRVLHDLVDEHGTDAIRATMSSLVDRRRAAVTVLTCHKAKGLEFDRVRINSNWEIDEDPAAVGGIDELRDEYRLAYVALTRARRELDAGTLLPPAEDSSDALFDVPGQVA